MPVDEGSRADDRPAIADLERGSGRSPDDRLIDGDLVGAVATVEVRVPPSGEFVEERLYRLTQTVTGVFVEEFSVELGVREFYGDTFLLARAPEVLFATLASALGVREAVDTRPQQDGPE